MKNNPDQNSPDPLLDAILRAESWEPVNAAAKAAALRELSVLRRRRHWLSTAAVTLAAGLAAAVIWPTLPSSPPQLQTPSPKIETASSNQHSAISNPLPSSVASPSSSQLETPNSKPETSSPAVAASPLPPAPVRHITEAQLLALFPKGSCLIAEINGQEQLVFFDHQIETQGAPYHPGS